MAEHGLALPPLIGWYRSNEEGRVTDHRTRRTGAPQTADRIFMYALALPASERSAYLENACAGNEPMLAEVQSLLGAHAKAGSFLRSPALERATPDSIPSPPSPITAAPPHESRDANLGLVVGAYRIKRRIGSGGMGSVYIGERVGSDFQKRVAIKFIKTGMDTEEILRRFRNERRVLANLEHPNIARLIDGGATEDGRPYLIMEYVDGIAIDQYCAVHHLSTTDRLSLFRQVCAAVQSAHDQRVVHRDLKPGNILVAAGIPKLLDFGISKVLRPEGVEQTMDHTVAGARFLSLKYASPEQVRGDPVTTSSDIYSLGVLFYELLTGVSPYPETDRGAEVRIRQITEHHPERPSQRALRDQRPSRARGVSWRPANWRPRDRLSRDLDTVVLKALRKEPERRYASAAQFSDDLGRCMSGDSILARPDSLRYRIEKFVVRNRVALIAGTLIFAVLVASSVVSTGLLVLAAVAVVALYLQSTRSKNSAQEARAEAEKQRGAADEISRFLQDMLETIHPESAQGRDVTLLREILDAAAQRVDRELAGRPEIAASLHLTIGNTYRNIAHYESAELHLENALRLRRENLAADDPRITEAVVHLAKCGFDSGSLRKSKSLYEEALARRETSHTAMPELVYAEIRNELGLVDQALGDVSRAESNFRKALEIRRRQLGDHHLDTAGSLNDLGQLLDVTDRSEEAEGCLREAMEIRRRYQGEHPLHFANSLHNLAGCLRDLGRFEEAEPLFLNAIELKRSVLEERHPSLAITLNNYAIQLSLQRRFEEAEPLYRETLETQRQVLGPDHADVGTAINNLGTLLRNTGRDDEAEALFREAVDVYSRALGPDHAFVAVAVGNLAAMHEKAGDWPECEECTERYLRVAGRNWPEEHWRMAHGRSLRAAILISRGALAEGERILLESLETLRRDRGDSDGYTQATIGRMITLYESWMRPLETARYRELLVPQAGP